MKAGCDEGFIVGGDGQSLSDIALVPDLDFEDFSIFVEDQLRLAFSEEFVVEMNRGFAGKCPDFNEDRFWNGRLFEFFGGRFDFHFLGTGR